MTVGIGELQATTDELRSKSVADMAANASILFYMMNKKGNVKEDATGRALYEEFAFAQNSSYQAILPTQELDLSFNQTIDAFVYTPKQSVVAAMITDLEKAQNQGASQVLNLMKERIKIGEPTMINEINSDLNGDGTGRGGLAFAGIRSYLLDDPTAATIGGVSLADAPAAQNVFQDLAGGASAPFNAATDSTNLEDKILVLKNRILEMGKEYCGYMGSEFFRLGAKALRGRQQLQNQELKSAGFGDHIVLEGIPFFLAGGYNPQGGTVIASDRFYIWSPDVFKFRTYKGYNMQTLETRLSTRQLVDVALRVCIGQFTCSDPSRGVVGFES